MVEPKLFMGFRVNAEFANALQAVSVERRSFFFQNDSVHLQEVSFLEERYVGKVAGETVDFASLELLEANIYSVLKKLIPGYDIAKIPLCLFPIFQ